MAISASDYSYLESHEDFWYLAASGVAALERTGSKRFALKGSGFVGQSLIGNRLLRIEEKIPGALAGLLEVAGNLDARITQTPALVDRHGRVVEQLAERFLASLAEYLLSGREKRYVTQSFVAGLPRGKVDLGRTMRLHARGRADLLAFRADVLSADLLNNRLLGLGLQALDRIVEAWSTGSQLLTRIRTIGVLFEDVGWPAMRRWSNDRLEAAFQRTTIEASSSNMGALLSLARIFALHFGVGATAEIPTPVSWFVNLESLFEDAVRMALKRAAQVCAPVVEVTDWRPQRRHVIDSSGKTLRAEPDVVVSTPAGSVAIFDAKYKDFDGTPRPDDVYQLLAHARAYGVTTCALVYPATAFTLRHAGDADGGCKLYVALLSITDMASDCIRLLQLLGISNPIPESTLMVA